MSPHLYSLCSQHKCRRNSSSISNTARRNDRYLHRVRDLRHEDHRGVLSDVSARLAAFGNYRVGAAALHTFCQCDRSNHRDHLHTCFLPHLHIFLRIPCSGGHHLDAFLGNDLRNLVRIWAHQHDIHPERTVRQLLRFLNLLPHPLGRSACGADQPQSSCIGCRRRQVILCNPCHTALDDRIFNS